MGYTNYWTLASKISKEQRSLIAMFTKKCIELSDVKICSWNGKGKPTINTKTIKFNGTVENDLSHDSFILYTSGWLFCKTARKPYDVVVKAVLMYAKEVGAVTEWSADGEETEEEFIHAKRLHVRVKTHLYIDRKIGS